VRVVVVVAVPDPVWVFDTGIVRVCDVDPVEVFEAAGLLVDVMVVLIVFVRRDVILNEGDADDVFDTGAEREPDGDAVGVFVPAVDRVYEGVALDVFDLMPVSVDVLLIYDDTEFIEVDDDVFEEVELWVVRGDEDDDLLLVTVLVDVLLKPAVNVVVVDGDIGLVERPDLVDVDVRVDVFDEVGVGVGITIILFKLRVSGGAYTIVDAGLVLIILWFNTGSSTI